MSGHLNHEQLLERLYGIGGREAHAHLLECEECAGRYAAYERRQSEAILPVEPSSDFLAAQRRAVYARMSQPMHHPGKWAPALVAGVLLAIGLFFYRPSAPERAAPAAGSEISDEQLFSDVYSIEESAEPRAAAPIQRLFEPAVAELSGEGQN